MADIKSNAVVKYSAMKSPAPYCELELNTNLNPTPTKLLQGRFGEKEPFVPGRSSTNAGKEMNSFLIANNYLDYVGSVDTITDAENVKKLLKMPYSKSGVSMMVHRIGKSLLIDRFDVYKHVLMAQQQEWKWLREFIVDTLLDSGTSQALIQSNDPNRKDNQEKLMLSKFLCYSLAEGQLANTDNETATNISSRSESSILVPDPLGTEEMSGIATTENLYERHVLWKLEDIRMLVGNDMPIFGGGTHPCVSLRLRDMKKPINVLTGIDYWLDQLMCNVPEVVMCYHLNGIVQKYEVIKTEDIPNLPDCKFNPEIVRDVAQNILSFLKSNATKEGHTYWLFKGHGDDVVKLYDLTSICKEYMAENYVNPFTIPVAVLMYRVARNLLQKIQTASTTRASSTVYRLLNYCLDLIDKNMFPQICSSVHYLLATLYITCGFPVADNQEKKEAQQDVKSAIDEALDDNFDDSFDLNDWLTYDDDPCRGVLPLAKPLDSNRQGSNCSSVSLNLLTKMNSTDSDDNPQPTVPQSGNDSRHIPNCSNLEDCCKTALEHIYESLECIEIYANLSVQHAASSENEEQPAPKPADTSKPIPLRYEPLGRLESTAKLLPLAVRKPAEATSSFQPELSILLMVKAATAYYLLAECSFKLENYGKALRYVNLTLLCYESISHSFEAGQGTDNGPTIEAKRQGDMLLRNVLLLCGDIHLRVIRQDPHGICKDRRDLNCHVYRDEKISEKFRKSLPENHRSDYSWCVDLPDSMEQNLCLSSRCYETAGKLIKDAVGAVEGRGGSPKKTNKLLEGKSDIKEAFSGLVIDSVIVTKRQGNVKNELGLYYMNVALAIASKEEDKKIAAEKVEKYWQASYACFQEGISLFRAINDDANEALLNCNCARLMRTCAAAIMDANAQCGDQEDQYYRKAIDLYQRALECVRRKSCTETDISNSIAWDLSSTYFTLATQLQERPPLSCYTIEEIERDLVDLMHKALRLVENLDRTNPSKHDIYLYRASVIHQKLASLHYRLFMEKEAEKDKKAKQQKQLAELHYSKASDGFRELVAENPCEFIRVQLERVALVEHGIESVSSSTKQKLYRDALQLLFSCRAAFISLCGKLENCQPSLNNGKDGPNAFKSLDELNLSYRDETRKQSDGIEVDQAMLKECTTLCSLLQERLQELCKSYLKLCLANSSAGSKSGHGKEKQELESTGDQWKLAYRATLQKMPSNVVNMPRAVLTILDQVLKELT